MLNTDLVVRRRHELGLSQRHVARQLGVSLVTVRALEAGTNHDDLPLRLISRLADTLGCDITDLLAAAEPARNSSDPRRVSAVGALLASADAPVDLETLADALGCELAKVRELLQDLDAALRPCGLRVGSAAGLAQLLAEVSERPDGTFERLLRGQQARRGLTATDASVLYRAMAGTLEPGRLTNDQQVAYARLLNAGLLETNDRLADDVVFSTQTAFQASDRPEGLAPVRAPRSC